MSVSPQELVVVLDFGSQYTQLIARRIREQRVYSVVLPFDTPVDEAPRARAEGDHLFRRSAVGVRRGRADLFARGLRPRRPDPRHLLRHAAHRVPARRQGRSGVPDREYRPRGNRRHANDSPLFAGTPAHQRVWASHGDQILRAPAGFRVTAASPNAPIAAFENGERPVLRHSVSSRGHAQRGGNGDPPQLPLRHRATARRRGTSATSASARSTRSAQRSATATSSRRSAAASTPPSPRCSWPRRSAISSRRSLSTTECCGRTKRLQVMSRLSEGLGMHIVAVDATRALLRQTGRRRRSGD